MIYEQCLVSTKMIPLSNLKTRHDERPICSRLSLNTGLLRVNRQVHTEAQGFLYAQNTFSVDILASWECTGVRPASCLSDRIICAKCSALSISHEFLSTKQQAADTLSVSEQRKSDNLAMPHKSLLLEQRDADTPTQWLANTDLIRRLHVTLQPYSFYQWQSCNAVFPLVACGCSPTICCSHQFQHALPPKMSLDVLIIHLSKPAMINSDDLMMWCYANCCAAEYMLGNTAEKWKRHVRRDMKREICWLMSFARGAGRNVVLASSPWTWELDPRMMTMLTRENACRTRKSRCESVHTAVPSWLRRSGQLSKASKRVLSVRNIIEKDRSYEFMPGRDYVNEVSQHLGDSGLLLIGSAGSDLLHDSF